MASGCWKPARQKYGVVVTTYDSAAVLHSLSLQFGETVHILEEYWADEKTVTWLRGCSFNNKSKKGIFPAAYVHTKECTVENEGPNEVVTPVEDAIIKEVTFVLREWRAQWKSLFVSRRPLFKTIFMVMGDLCKFRSSLVSNTLTKEHAEELKKQVVTRIDWGNGQLGMDLVPRVNYQQADPDNVSVVEMFRIHEQSVKNCQEAYPGSVIKVKGREVEGEAIHHLQVSLCSFACSVGDNSEVLLSLYDSREGKFVSEKFVMYFTKDGQREGIDKNNSTIFTDLTSEDIRKDWYLVVQILRKGRLITEGNHKKSTHFQYRRPWGVSVLCLKDVPCNDSEQEYFLRVQCVENESFNNMPEALIKKQIQMTGKVPSTDKQNQGITLSLKILQGDMKTVRIENPLIFNKGVVLTQPMGFPDFINPGEIRNDLYLTLHGADLDRGNKTASKNIEVCVTVYNDQYELIKDCIFPATGDTMKPNFLTHVLYHNNNPRWNETIRLSIPIEKFSTAHIRLELYHCSNRDKAEKKMFGFAYLSVTTKENTTRLDGKYELCIYKCEDFAKVKNYLRLPSLKDDFSDPKLAHNIPNNIPYHHSKNECITVETLLCSSKFAQKAELLRVLQWAANSNRENFIPQSLDQLVRLRGQELVRYLQDILDALFNMFTAGDGRPVPFASQIFETLVHIFNLLHEEMFEKFSIVLEDYLEKSFSSPLAHKELMQCLKIQAERVYTCTDFDEKSSRKVFKVLDDIFKFSVKSCMLSQRIYGGQSVPEFRENLNKIFEAFGKVVSSHESELQKVQEHLLNNLHKAYVPLLLIISNIDLAQLVVFILTKINLHQGEHVIKAKTNLIKNTINSQLILDNASREMMLPLILNHLKTCLINHQHLELTANTLGDLLTTVYKLKETTDVTDEVTKIIQGVFDVTVRTLGTCHEKRKKSARSLLVACLTEMLRLMHDFAKHSSLRGRLSTVIMPMKAGTASKEFLYRIMMVFRNLVKADDLPSDWTTMRMIINSVMLTSITYIAEDLTVNFHGPDFDRELWYNFFLLSVDFITQPALQLEKYSAAKSSQIRRKYKDMRIPVGLSLYSLWNNLGQNQQHLMLELIGPFLKCTMVPQLDLRKATIPIFFDIMQCEYQLKGHLRKVEGVMIQELDSLVLEHHGDADYKKWFQSILFEKIQATPQLQEEGKRFIFSVTDLLERLLNYREIMDREEQRDTKMYCTFNILNFYKDNRRDMYIRYISRLYELHYSAGSFVEAGLTLQLYAQLLTWSHNIHQAEMSYPNQSESARKEELFSRILDCFDKGKAWEYGIPICKELADHYEKIYEYRKLGQILQKQAYFLYQILEGNKLRQKPTYYRVSYFGNTFPTYLKNKAFIYRGDECLKLSTIMNHLMTEYPSANILTTNYPPDKSSKLGDSQCIQIVSVKQVASERPEFIGKDVPSEITSFYSNNEIDTFEFDRPYHREGKDKNNEFKTLCLERTIMQTSYKLPGILRSYEVTSTKVVHLGPVQTATDTVKQMNAELKTSAENAEADQENCLRHLEMRLQGVICGAVNGGIPKYQEAFFNKEYIAKYPDEKPYIDELKSVIQEQIKLLEHGLSIHGKLASSQMKPLYENLVDTFTKMKKSMGFQNLPSKNRGSAISVDSGSQSAETPSQISGESDRLSVLSNDDDDDGISEGPLYMEPPEFPLPTYKHSTSLSDDPVIQVLLTNLHSISPVTPPPVPTRKKSISSGSFSECDRPSNSAVSRSDSTKSTNSSGSDVQIRSSKIIASSPSDTGDADFKAPPLPAKRPSVTSVLIRKESNTSLTSRKPALSKVVSTVDNSDADTGGLTQHEKSNTSAPASSHDGLSSPLSVVAKIVSNNTPHQLTPTSHCDQPPQVASRPHPPTPPSTTDQTPPAVSQPNPPTPSANTEEPPPVVSRFHRFTPSTAEQPPPIVSRLPINKNPPPPLLYTQSNMQTAVTPPRPNSKGPPPPIPKRNPSVNSS
ncbi:hypothetical protein BsWGS_13919 [Bradybaena similaris]